MRRFFGSVILICAAVVAQAQDLPRPSPKASLQQRVGLSDVSISYSRPGVKGRTIWGDLVPYDKVWRTGANEATIITISDDATVNGQKLPKGTYSLHTIPGQSGWAVMFNSVANPNGPYSYDAAKDVLKVNVTPRASEHTEWMDFDFENLSDKSADLVLRWEKIAVPVTLTFDTNAKAVASIRTALGEGDWRIAYRSAQYAFDNELPAEDGLRWIDRSIATQKTYANLTLKARMLAKRGDRKAAIATAEEAVRVGKAATPAVDTTSTEKLIAEWKAK